MCIRDRSCTYLQPGTDVDGSAQMLLRTSSGISASISLCGYSVVPIDETMLFFANGSLRLHTGSDLSVTCGSGYETDVYKRQLYKHAV